MVLGHSLLSLALLLLNAHAIPVHEDKPVWTARIKRQALDNNATNHSQPMIFNHVYNINVPLETLCSANLDSSENDKPMEEYQEQIADSDSNSDSQVTFTHRINIPKSACSCPTISILQQLASRIESMEREMLLLRAQCTGTCCGENSGMGESIVCLY